MIVFAPGVTFDKEKHEYHYQGVKLSGVTCKVGPKTSYGHMSESFKGVLGELAAEGNHVHDAVEEWIKSGFTKWNTIHPNAIFVRDKLLEMGNMKIQAETLVSDFKFYASPIDVMIFHKKNTIDIYDIKRSFNRDYVAWQLSIYKYLIEEFSKYKVRKMGAFATKDKRFFDDIEYKGRDQVRELLYGKEEICI
jgi:hypothetical protein